MGPSNNLDPILLCLRLKALVLPAHLDGFQASPSKIEPFCLSKQQAKK